MYNFEYQTFTSFSIFFLLGIITFTEVKDLTTSYTTKTMQTFLNYDLSQTMIMVIAANCMKPQLKSKVYGKLTFCALSRLSALFAAVPQRLNQELSG